MKYPITNHDKVSFPFNDYHISRQNKNMHTHILYPCIKSTQYRQKVTNILQLLLRTEYYCVHIPILGGEYPTNRSGWW